MDDGVLGVALPHALIAELLVAELSDAELSPPDFSPPLSLVAEVFPSETSSTSDWSSSRPSLDVDEESSMESESKAEVGGAVDVVGVGWPGSETI